MSNSIQEHLANMIKRAGASPDKGEAQGDKTAGDVSAKIDSADDGTSPATTGERAAENKRDAAEYTTATVDGGAKTNPANASVSDSTDGATAGTDQRGGKGADMEPVKDADNGKEKPENKIAAIRELIEDARTFAGELRKQAGMIIIEKRKGADDEEAEKEEDKEDDYKEDDKGDDKTAADKGGDEPKLDKLGQYLVHLARNSNDANLRKTAADMDDAALADAATEEMMHGLESGEIDDQMAGDILADAEEFGAVGDEDLEAAGSAAAEELIAAIESGQLSEEDAAVILDELMQSGAVTEEDLTAADQLMEAGLEGDMPVDDAPVGEPTAEDIAAAEELAGEDVAGALTDAGVDEKVARLVATGPSDKGYVQKLASVYGDYVDAGRKAFHKLAEDLLADKTADSHGQSLAAQPATNEKATNKGGNPAGVTGLTDSVAKQEGEATEKMASEALSEVMEELGLSDEDLHALEGTKVASSEDPKERLKDEFRVHLLAKAAAAHSASNAK